MNLIEFRFFCFIPAGGIAEVCFEKPADLAFDEKH